MKQSENTKYKATVTVNDTIHMYVNLINIIYEWMNGWMDEKS